MCRAFGPQIPRTFCRSAFAPANRDNLNHTEIVGAPYHADETQYHDVSSAFFAWGETSDAYRPARNQGQFPCYPARPDTLIAWPAAIEKANPKSATTSGTPRTRTVPAFGADMATPVKAAADVLFLDTGIDSYIVSDTRLLDHFVGVFLSSLLDTVCYFSWHSYSFSVSGRSFSVS